MSITSIGPLLYQAVTVAATTVSEHYEKIDCIYNVVQAWQTKKASENFTDFTKTYEQKRWQWLDAVSLIATGAMLLGAWERASGYISRRVDAEFGFAETAFFVFILVQGGALLGAFVVGSFLFSMCKPKLKDFLPDQNVEVIGEAGKITMYVARIVMNVALISFSVSGAFFAISVAAQTYSLILVLKRKWIEITYKTPANTPHAGDVTFTYKFLLGSSKAAAVAQCTLCEDDEDDNDSTPPTALFCQEHRFHEGCLITHLNGKMTRMNDGVDYERSMGTHTTHYRVGNSMVSRTEPLAKYTLRIPQGNRPDCPACHAAPSHNRFSVAIQDTTHRATAAYQWVAPAIT